MKLSFLNTFSVPKIPSQVGGINVVLLLALPLIVLIGVSAIAIEQILVMKSQGEEVCRKEVIRSQKILAKGIQELMKLNPKASLIRKKVTLARAQLIAAIASANMSAIAVARARLNRVRAEQEALHKTQISILYAYNASLKYQERGLGSLLNRFSKNPDIIPQKMDLQAIPIFSRSPNYVPYTDHEQRHCFGAIWKFRLQDSIGGWALKLSKIKDVWSFSCGVSQRYHRHTNELQFYFAKDKCL